MSTMTLAFADPPRAVANALGTPETCRVLLSDRIANGVAFADERIVRWLTLSECACEIRWTDHTVRIDGWLRCARCGHPIGTGVRS